MRLNRGRNEGGGGELIKQLEGEGVNVFDITSCYKKSNGEGQCC